MTTLKIHNRQFAAGLIFLCIGIFAAVYALQYRLGTATSMGPGYFPLGVALVLAILGLLTMIAGLREARNRRQSQQSMFASAGMPTAETNATYEATVVEPGITVIPEDQQGTRPEPAEFQLGMLVILAGVVLFGEVLRHWGLVPAVGILTIVVCYKRWRTRPLEVIVMAVALMAVTAGLFVYLLGMPFTLFKT